MTAPQFVIIAGPNGAGKSTGASSLLPKSVPYINADEIAKGLSPQNVNRDMEASRQLLERCDRFEQENQDFAIETTLASRSLAARIQRLKRSGYQFELFFLWLPSEELAVQRVKERVRAGGHDIPERTIRRRYRVGIQNFVTLYRPLADTWVVLQNLAPGAPEVIASGSGLTTLDVVMHKNWERLLEYSK